jgi:hypothetical protein
MGGRELLYPSTTVGDGSAAPSPRPFVRLRFKVLKRFIFWDYPRASWQYDVMVGIIVVFVMLAPRWWKSYSSPLESRCEERNPGSVVVVGRP